MFYVSVSRLHLFEMFIVKVIPVFLLYVLSENQVNGYLKVLGGADRNGNGYIAFDRKIRDLDTLQNAFQKHMENSNSFTRQTRSAFIKFPTINLPKIPRVRDVVGHIASHLGIKSHNCHHRPPSRFEGDGPPPMFEGGGPPPGFKRGGPPPRFEEGGAPPRFEEGSHPSRFEGDGPPPRFEKHRPPPRFDGNGPPPWHRGPGHDFKNHGSEHGANNFKPFRNDGSDTNGNNFPSPGNDPNFHDSKPAPNFPHHGVGETDGKLSNKGIGKEASGSFFTPEDNGPHITLPVHEPNFHSEDPIANTPKPKEEKIMKNYTNNEQKESHKIERNDSRNNSSIDPGLSISRQNVSNPISSEEEGYPINFPDKDSDDDPVSDFTKQREKKKNELKPVEEADPESDYDGVKVPQNKNNNGWLSVNEDGEIISDEHITSSTPLIDVRFGKKNA